MAITIIATAGASDANSYITLADAEVYFETRVGSTVWDNATDEQKKALLVNGTRQLDQNFRWNGSIASDTQSLRWPRTDAYNCDGEEQASDTIPVDIENATCEMALFVGETTGGTQDNSVKSAKVGSLEVEYRDNISASSSVNSATSSAVGCLGEASNSGNVKLEKY
jgi:hypothetical protein